MRTVKNPSPSAGPSTILVLHAGALGDCALALQLVGAMRACWGDPAVAMAARSPLTKWAKQRGLIGQALSLDGVAGPLFCDSAAGTPENAAQLLRSFDLIVSFLGGPTEAVSVRLAAIGRANNRVVSIDPRPTKRTLARGTHITRQWANVLAECGYHLYGFDRPAIFTQQSVLRTDDPGRLASRLGVSTASVALCHPGSGGLEKCLPMKALERLMCRLNAQGWVAGWIIGPDEVERFGASYEARLATTGSVIYEESVSAAADLVCGADVLLGHDAGMTHVAALAGVRTIAIFGPTDPRVWRPLGEKCQVEPFPAYDDSLDEWAGQLVARIEPSAN